MINPREEGPPAKVVPAFGTTAPLHAGADAIATASRRSLI
jgi:hypothetical protein